MQNEGLASRFGLEGHGLERTRTAFWNLSPAELYEQSILRGEAKIASDGPLLCATGAFTGGRADGGSGGGAGGTSSVPTGTYTRVPGCNRFGSRSGFASSSSGSRFVDP